MDKMFFVADEGDGVLNAFAREDFDKDGYYNEHNGEEGYHITDFDIVFETNRWNELLMYMDLNSKS